MFQRLYQQAVLLREKWQATKERYEFERVGWGRGWFGGCRGLAGRGVWWFGGGSWDVLRLAVGGGLPIRTQMPGGAGGGGAYASRARNRKHARARTTLLSYRDVNYSSFT